MAGDEEQVAQEKNKRMKNLLLGVVFAGALTMSVSANPTVLTGANDVAAKDLPGLGDQQVLTWLQGLAGGQPAVAANSYSNLGAGVFNAGAGDYLVLHYGVGDGGVKGSGGGLVALYFPNPESYNIPANGSGPNGLGGLSFARLYDPTPETPPTRNTVPDGGMSMAMLGLGMGSLALFSRGRRQK